VVETELRDVHVSLLTGACDEAKGIEEAIPHTTTEKQYVPRLPSNVDYISLTA